MPVTTATRPPRGTSPAIVAAARRPPARLSVPMQVVIVTPTASAASRLTTESTLTTGASAGTRASARTRFVSLIGLTT